MNPLDASLPQLHALDGAGGMPIFRLPREFPGAPTYRIGGEGETLRLQDALARLEEAERVIAEQRERIEALEAQTLSDELTGLLNRRGFRDAFASEMAACARSGTGGVLVMVDLDGFKAINDRLGHAAGDHYLMQVGKALRKSVRAHDVVARLGGDEFVVLLTRSGDDQGLARAEELAARIAAQSTSWNGEILPLRASFGAEPFTAHDKPGEVMRRADVRMYAAKQAGKRHAA